MATIDKNKTYIGVVEDNNDPKKIGRCKVRVMDVFEGIDLKDIPWAFPWKDLNGNMINIPDKGKVVMVVFDQGNQNSPEYIYADHYNVNLEKKLQSLPEKDYISMKSLLFDHKTQIYVNDAEGLKLDHKYNNINITENTIDLNLKDNNRNLNIGDAAADQQAILGNHWLDWFDEFVENLLGTNAGPFLGNLGAPVIPNPGLITCLLRYKALRDPVFLSHHVNIVDNNKVKTVGLSKREDDPQIGDKWESTKEENTVTTKTDENFKPVDGPKKEFDDSPSAIKDLVNQAKNQLANGLTPSVVPEITKTNSVKSDPLIDKLIKFMSSKKYEISGEPNVLNIVGVRGKDDGTVTNKFDDTLYVFFRNVDYDEKGTIIKESYEIFDFPITTLPGFVPQTQEQKDAGDPLVLPTNVKILANGQYKDQLKLDTLNGDPGYKCLKFINAAYYVNDKVDKYNYRAKIEQGTEHTFTIKRSSDMGSAENVFNYSSDGSQVFKNITQYNQFISLCERQLEKNKENGVSKFPFFTYTLCRKSDFDGYIPEKEKEKTVKNNTQNNQQPKPMSGDDKLEVIIKRLGSTAQVVKEANGNRQVHILYNSQRNKIVFFNNGRFITQNVGGSGFISKGSFDDGGRILVVTEGLKNGKTFKSQNLWETLALYKK